ARGGWRLESRDLGRFRVTQVPLEAVGARGDRGQLLICLLLRLDRGEVVTLRRRELPFLRFQVQRKRTDYVTLVVEECQAHRDVAVVGIRNMEEHGGPERWVGAD